MDYAIGAAVQWITRGNDKIPVKLRELLALVAVAIGAGVVFWLSPDFANVHSFRDFVLGAMPGLEKIAVGTLGTSMLANQAVAVGAANAGSAFVPVTQTQK